MKSRPTNAPLACEAGVGCTYQGMESRQSRAQSRRPLRTYSIVDVRVDACMLAEMVLVRLLKSLPQELFLTQISWR